MPQHTPGPWTYKIPHATVQPDLPSFGDHIDAIAESVYDMLADLSANGDIEFCCCPEYGKKAIRAVLEEKIAMDIPWELKAYDAEPFRDCRKPIVKSVQRSDDSNIQLTPSTIIILNETLRTFSEAGLYPEFVAAVQDLLRSNLDKQVKINQLLGALAKRPKLPGNSVDFKKPKTPLSEMILNGITNLEGRDALYLRIERLEMVVESLLRAIEKGN